MNNFEIDDIEETIKAASNNLSMSCITIKDLEQCYQQLYKKKPPHYYFTKQTLINFCKKYKSYFCISDTNSTRLEKKSNYTSKNKTKNTNYSSSTYKELYNAILKLSKYNNKNFFPISDLEQFIGGRCYSTSFRNVLTKTLEILTNRTDKTYKISTSPYGFYVYQKAKQTITIETNILDGNKITLFVYANMNNVTCIKLQIHKHKNVTISTKNSLRKDVTFNAFYCPTCNRYFTTIDVIKEKFPLLNFPIIKFDLSTYTQETNRMPESELTLYGYSVKADGLSESQRQSILSQLLTMKILSKSRIITIISNNISYNGRKKNLETAVQKWKRDLDFVQNFNIDKQQKIITDNVNIIYKGNIIK